LDTARVIEWIEFSGGTGGRARKNHYAVSYTHFFITLSIKNKKIKSSDAIRMLRTDGEQFSERVIMLRDRAITIAALAECPIFYFLYLYFFEKKWITFLKKLEKYNDFLLSAPFIIAP